LFPEADCPIIGKIGDLPELLSHRDALKVHHN